jgi:hypothetical protein
VGPRSATFGGSSSSGKNGAECGISSGQEKVDQKEQEILPEEEVAKATHTTGKMRSWPSSQDISVMKS